MVQAYTSNMQYFSYRWKQYVWQGITGIRFVYFLVQFDKVIQQISQTSLSHAAWNVLEEFDFLLAVDWQIDPEMLKTSPIIFYAKHPGYIEPLPILAALKEFNPKIIATAWLRNISESVSSRVISVPDSREAVYRNLQRYTGMRRILETLWAHLVIFQVIKYLQGDMPVEECRQQRLVAIRDILSTLAEGESILFFPSGGDGQKPWVKRHTATFEKLMRIIIRRQKDIAPLNELCFVPVISKPTFRVLFKSQLMIPWHPFSFLFRLLPNRPFQIVIKEKISLRDILQKTTDSEKIVCDLMERLEQ